MLFLELYTSALDNELGTSATELFTVARRKAAINEAEKAFVRETGIARRYGSVPIVSGTGLYSTDTITGFNHLAGDISIKIVTGSTIRYIQGPEAFPRYEFEELDREFPGWQSAPAGTPSAWYMVRNGAFLVLGLSPTPSFSTGTWTIQVPYISSSSAGGMVNDDDAPLEFTDGFGAVGSYPDGYPIFQFYRYHQALVHYAASKLERLRKNYDGAKMQMAEFNNYVNKWFIEQQRDSKPQIQVAHSYMRKSRCIEDGRT